MAGAGEGRDRNGGGGHRQQFVGPPGQAGEQAGVEGACRHDTGTTYQPHRFHVR